MLQCRLGSAVAGQHAAAAVGVGPVAGQPGRHGGDVDDRAAARGDHVRADQLHQLIGGEHRDLEVPAIGTPAACRAKRRPVGFGRHPTAPWPPWARVVAGLRRAAGRGERRVVDQDRDGAQRISRLARPAGQCRRGRADRPGSRPRVRRPPRYRRRSHRWCRETARPTPFGAPDHGHSRRLRPPAPARSPGPIRGWRR